MVTRRLSASIWTLALLLIGIAWARSYFRNEGLTYTFITARDSRNLQINWVNGSLVLECDRFPLKWGRISLKSGMSAFSLPNQDWKFFSGDYAGFSVFSDWLSRSSRQSAMNLLHVPFRFLALLCLCMRFWQWRSSSLKRKSQSESHIKCTHCGYDLRASRDRCPECGTPIPASPIRAV